MNSWICYLVHRYIPRKKTHISISGSWFEKKKGNDPGFNLDHLPGWNMAYPSRYLILINIMVAVARAIPFVRKAKDRLFRDPHHFPERRLLFSLQMFSYLQGNGHIISGILYGERHEDCIVKVSQVGDGRSSF
jgi:hypothetical protein